MIITIAQDPYPLLKSVTDLQCRRPLRSQVITVSLPRGVEDFLHVTVYIRVALQLRVPLLIAFPLLFPQTIVISHYPDNGALFDIGAKPFC
jgi:hypothetical protein